VRNVDFNAQKVQNFKIKPRQSAIFRLECEVKCKI